MLLEDFFNLFNPVYVKSKCKNMWNILILKSLSCLYIDYFIFTMMLWTYHTDMCSVHILFAGLNDKKIEVIKSKSGLIYLIDVSNEKLFVTIQFYLLSTRVIFQ